MKGKFRGYERGESMKSLRHYLLIPVYIGTVIFILIINGVFTGDVTSVANLAINVGFLVIMGILLLISVISLAKVSNCTEDLLYRARQLEKESQSMDEEDLCQEYLNRQDVFRNEELNQAFEKFQITMEKYRTRRGFQKVCDMEEYINEDLIDEIGKNFYNSNMPETLTGLGILGTFLGLTMGLATFNGQNVLAISDSMGPLLEGMKVAFHTSVYGIFLSLVFGFIYKATMAEAYTAVEKFRKAFRQYATPESIIEKEDAAAMIVYQANMASMMKQMLELLNQDAKVQTIAVERMVDKFMDGITEAMGENLGKLGTSLKNVSDSQNVATQNNKELLKTVELLLLANHDLQEKMEDVVKKQDRFAMELKQQKQELLSECNEMSKEISSQLYAFDKMRNLYEK